MFIVFWFSKQVKLSAVARTAIGSVTLQPLAPEVVQRKFHVDRQTDLLFDSRGLLNSKGRSRPRFSSPVGVCKYIRIWIYSYIYIEVYVYIHVYKYFQLHMIILYSWRILGFLVCFECGRKGREQQTHNPIGRKTTLFFGLACALLEATVNVHTYCYFKHVQPMSQAQAGAVVSLIFWGKIEIAVGVSNMSHRQAPSPGWNASLRSSKVVCIGGYVEETSVKSSDLFHTHWMLGPQKLFTLNILSLSGPLRLETAFPYIST